MTPKPAQTKYPAVTRVMPRTSGLPVVGSLPVFFRQPFAFLLTARERHGDIYALDLGLSRWVILNHPRHAEYMMRDNGQNYQKGGRFWEVLRKIYGNGLVVSEGDFWLRQRRMIQPHFHRKQLAGITDSMVSAVVDSTPVWDAAANTQQPFGVARGFAGITMRVISRTLFGQGFSREELDKLGQHVALILDHVMTGMLTHQLPRWFPVPGRRHYMESLQKLDAMIAEIILHERNAAVPSDSLLAMLVGMVDEQTGERMTDKQLRDEVLTFFAAGYETSALALTWILYLLTQHPEVMQKLRAEVEEVLGDRTPTFADLARLTYTRMVIQESLRLRPPSWWVPRTAAADDVIDGYPIPAGSTVVFLTYGLHHHPEVWKNPERFDPERFTEEQIAQRHKLAWMPFGAGQRQCIGKDFAIMESQIILAMITQRYNITAVPGPAIVPEFSSLLNPSHNVQVYLEKCGA